MRRSTLVIASFAAVTTLVLTGCSSSKKPAPAATTSAAAPASTTSAAPAVSGTITVLAASSLTEAFTTIGKQFKALHPDVSITFNFEASSAAALQITQGVKADVFASASPKNMTMVAKFVGTPTNFVSNTMEIAVPPGNPGHVTALADLAKKTVKVALCQAQVPCGTAAAAVFKNAKLTVKPVTLEPDVKSTLAKVELKSVDAGIVYVSDVHAAGSKVTGIVIPAGVNAVTEYPIATLTRAPNSAVAKAFVAYVLSPAGQSVLQAEGFAKS